MIEVLIDYGASIWPRTWEGKNAFDQALTGRHEQSMIGGHTPAC